MFPKINLFKQALHRKSNLYEIFNITFVSNIYTKELIITSFIRLPDLFISVPW